MHWNDNNNVCTGKLCSGCRAKLVVFSNIAQNKNTNKSVCVFDSLRTVSERILPTYPPWKRGRAMKCRSTLITFAPSTIATWRVLAGMGGGGRSVGGSKHSDAVQETVPCTRRRICMARRQVNAACAAWERLTILSIPFFFLPLAAAERQKPALTTTTTAGRPSVCPFGAPPLLSPFYPSPCPSSLHLCLSTPKAFTSLLRPGNCR